MEIQNQDLNLSYFIGTDAAEEMQIPVFTACFSFQIMSKLYL